MATTFTIAYDETGPLLQECLKKWHKPLLDAEATFQTFFAWNESGDALKHHGWPALAMIKIVPYKDRVAGLADVRLNIDGAAWEEWDKARRLAVLDHELTHCVLVKDDQGAVKTDDCGRPKMKMRQHDFQCGWFKDVLEKHREASAEYEQMQVVAKDWIQATFWG